MTDEHVPPLSTNNASPIGRVDYPFDLNSVVHEVAEWNEGHVVSTLDRGCNERASNWGYVKEYRCWFELVVEHSRAIVKRTNADPLRGTQSLEMELPYDVHPARFVRQVVGMLLAVQSTEHLMATYPVLPKLVGPDPSDVSKRRLTGLDIEPLRLYMSVCNAKWSYLNRPMLAVEMSFSPRSKSLWTPSSTTSRLDEAQMLCLSPFTFVLTTKDASDLGYDISDWSRWSVDQRPKKDQRRLILPTVDQLQGGLRAMVYPAEYVV